MPLQAKTPSSFPKRCFASLQHLADCPTDLRILHAPAAVAEARELPVSGVVGSSDDHLVNVSVHDQVRVERYECPAEAGQMRCPLKAHSMAYPDDVPAVLDPPERATAPTCCSQRTVELGEDAQGKFRQEHRWSTDTWIKAYGRRTFVEGGFGVLRNPALGGLSRGLFCIIGRIKVTLWLAALVAATNIAALAKWATRTAVDSADPALAPITDDDWAFEELDPSSTTGTDPPPPADPN